MAPMIRFLRDEDHERRVYRDYVEGRNTVEELSCARRRDLGGDMDRGARLSLGDGYQRLEIAIGKPDGLSIFAATDSAIRDSGGIRRWRALWAGVSLARGNYALGGKWALVPR